MKETQTKSSTPSRQVEVKGRPFFQAKLSVGAPGDHFEREADRIADRIVASDSAPPVQRGCAGCAPESKQELRRQPLEEAEELLQAGIEPGLQFQPVEEEEEEPLQTKPLSDQVTPLAALDLQRRCQECEEEPSTKLGAPRGRKSENQGRLAVQRDVAAAGTKASEGSPAVATHSTEQAISRLRGGGHPLPEAARFFMEGRFGADFSEVRVHDDQASAQLGTALNAQAFTVGKDVFFNQGFFNPASLSGKRLLAHELTHVLQQTSRRKAPRDTVQRTIGDGHDLTSALFSGNVVLEAVFDNQAKLEDGDSGTAVRLVQQALVGRGYELPRFGVDGIFGEETESAVRAFQVDVGAGVDGVVGFQTIGFLDQRLQGQPVAAAPPAVVGTALPAANVIVQPGWIPPRALPAGFCGLTWPENVAIDFVAVRNGPNWVPVVSGLTGNYSQQAQLLPGGTEVTGPAGNTTAANFCAQVTDLNNPPCGAAWYMRSAVVEHERVHASHFRDALIVATPAIEAAVEALSVPHVAGMNAAAAAAALQAQAGFAAAITNAQVLWLAQCVALGGHGNGTIDADTLAAETAITAPMLGRICAHARAQGWPACSPPCPP